MSSQPTPPLLARETLLALLNVVTEFAAAKPWADMFDSHVMGLTDPTTHEIRIGTVLGNAGEVFGLTLYRHTTGIRWLLRIMNDLHPDRENAIMMDCLKIEFLSQGEIPAGDLNLLTAVGFNPVGQGKVWPQFQSCQPGYVPWHINQAEAEELLADIPRMIKFCALFRRCPDLFEAHERVGIPYLPNPTPDRPLKIEDLDWQPLIVPPETINSFEIDPASLIKLRKLRRAKAAYEYGTGVMGCNVLEQGRFCYVRASLLIDHQQGSILCHHLYCAGEPFEQSAGGWLAKFLIERGELPKALFIADPRLLIVLGPFCEALGIDLKLLKELPLLAEAMASLDKFMATDKR